MISLKDSRLLEALASELHFGRTAERLGIAQPQVSLRLARLERSLGLQLFQRRPRVLLTSAGQVVLAAVRRSSADMEVAIARAKSAELGETGVVRIGFASTVMLSYLPELIGQFRAIHPSIDIRLRDLHSALQWDALRGDAIDVAITREMRPDPDVHREVLYSERFTAVLPVGHVLCDRDTLSLKELAGDSFVLFNPAVAPALYGQIKAVCTSAGFIPEVVQEATDWYTVFAFVSAGMGVTIAPHVLSRLHWPGLKHVELCSDDTLHADVFLCWRPRELSPSSALFVEWLLARIAERASRSEVPGLRA